MLLCVLSLMIWWLMRMVLLVPVRMAQFFLSCSLVCLLSSHGLGKYGPHGTELSTVHLYISKNQHIIGNDTTYDEIEQSLNSKQPFWSANGVSIKTSQL